MTRKKPWNRIDLPLYSISSKTATNRTMNILTYVTQVSMKPKRFVCALYHGTQTLENVTENPEFVLQLLDQTQYRLVNLLGRKTGKTVDKVALLEKRKLLSEWKGFQVLASALAVLHLRVISQFGGGDHEVFLCELINHKNLHDGTALTLNDLRKRNLIRI